MWLNANETAGFLSFIISKTIGANVILVGHGQACPKRLLKPSGAQFSCNLCTLILLQLIKLAKIFFYIFQQYLGLNGTGVKGF